MDKIKPFFFSKKFFFQNLRTKLVNIYNRNMAQFKTFVPNFSKLNKPNPLNHRDWSLAFCSVPSKELLFFCHVLKQKSTRNSTWCHHRLCRYEACNLPRSLYGPWLNFLAPTSPSLGKSSSIFSRLISSEQSIRVGSLMTSSPFLGCPRDRFVFWSASTSLSFFTGFSRASISVASLEICPMSRSGSNCFLLTFHV